MQATLETIATSARVDISTPQLNFSAACFEGNNWSLGPLQEAGDENRAPELAERVGQAMHGLQVLHAFGPNPTKFNGRIISQSVLCNQVRLGAGVILHRNQKVAADGTFLSSPHTAGIFSAGGCSMIVVVLGKEMVFAHAGRDCIIDRMRIKTRGRLTSRHRESVTNNIVAALAPSESLREKLRVWVFFSIKPEDFLHRSADEDFEHLEYNIPAAEMLPLEYGDACGKVEKDVGIYINVPTIIKAQFMKLGVPEKNIDLSHAFLKDEMPTTRNGGGRYLAAIVRNT